MAPPPPHPPAPPRLWRRPRLRSALCFVPLAAVVVWAAWHWPVVARGFGRLLTADLPWLLAAGATTALAWVAAALARQGAVVERLPAARLLAAQFAAGAANHLLPSGLGAGAVNLRFMTVCGVPLTRSSAALGLYLLAECLARVGLLLVLLVAFPRALRIDSLLPQDAAVGAGLPLMLAVIGALVGAALLVLLLVRPLRRAAWTFLSTALSEARSLHTRPARILALWGGSLAFPALQAAGLVAVGLALDVAIPVMHVAVAYLVASVAAAAIPTPGGLGSVDAALVVALVAAGAAGEAATAVVLVYRLITVWLPLLPGALTLGALVRWKVL